VELAPDVALIAGLIGEPVRAAILTALVGGRALPAGELAFIGNVAPQTASFHLRKLLDASLIQVERHGKHSYYRLANERVAATLESLAALAPVRKSVEVRSRSRYESERVQQLRFARSCYRHLAGILAVNVTQSLLDRDYVIANAGSTFSLTDHGLLWCRELGVDLESSRPDKPNRACLDWTERRHHIGGPLGAALLTRLLDLRWIARKPETRAVRVTLHGVKAFEQHFGIAITTQNGSGTSK
jgi:DNA-binding transcriptional ArsR family regulator